MIEVLVNVLGGRHAYCQTRAHCSRKGSRSDALWQKRFCCICWKCVQRGQQVPSSKPRSSLWILARDSQHSGRDPILQQNHSDRLPLMRSMASSKLAATLKFTRPRNLQKSKDLWLGGPDTNEPRARLVRPPRPAMTGSN